MNFSFSVLKQSPGAIYAARITARASWGRGQGDNCPWAREREGGQVPPDAFHWESFAIFADLPEKDGEKDRQGKKIENGEYWQMGKGR